MFNLVSVFALLSISTTVLAHPTALEPRDTGSCTNKHLLIEWAYEIGVNSYCDLFFLPPGATTPLSSKWVDNTHPLTGTVSLPAYDDNSIVKWVFKVRIQRDWAQGAMELTYDNCKEKFRSILTEGRLGNEYCVVDGTEDVLFQGGKKEEDLNTYGQIVYEVYELS